MDSLKFVKKRCLLNVCSQISGYKDNSAEGEDGVAVAGG
jgi:hypothetical protein